MLNKIKILKNTLVSTTVIQGSQFFFIFYFFLTHGINIIGKYSPATAAVLRKISFALMNITPASTRIFTIKNNTGIFEVVPLNDSMTISADYFEVHLLPWLEKPTQKRVFIDIGAHMGRYSILAGNRFHYSKIVAIEANPGTFATLKRNIGLNDLTKNVSLVQVALSDKAGIIEFATNTNNLAVGHVVSTTEGYAETEKIIRMQSQTASAVLAAEHIQLETIDFIKMDVEGFEDYVLKGMTNVLDKMQTGSHIMIEITDPEHGDAKKILEQHSFDLIAHTGADYLYAKK